MDGLPRHSCGRSTLGANGTVPRPAHEQLHLDAFIQSDLQPLIHTQRQSKTTQDDSQHVRSSEGEGLEIANYGLRVHPLYLLI